MYSNVMPGQLTPSGKNQIIPFLLHEQSISMNSNYASTFLNVSSNKIQT